MDMHTVLQTLRRGLPAEPCRSQKGPERMIIARVKSLRHPFKGASMRATLANGKICYVEIPATDVHRSVAFYQSVFGWNIRSTERGETAFDDGVGEVSGRWVRGRAPSPEPGLLIYVMVDSVAATIDAIVAQGGQIVQPIGADAPEITARFRDPGGNVVGLYQQPA